MSTNVVIAGVGMIPFAKPGASKPYDEMGAEAARIALFLARQAVASGAADCGHRFMPPPSLVALAEHREPFRPRRRT